MKNYLLLSVILFIVGCQSSPQSEEDKQEKEFTSENLSALDSLHPNNLAEDLSWIVSINDDEGFAQSYTITYQNGEEKTVGIDEFLPIVGGLDHPPAHFINDTTYYVPHLGSSENGHFELYIYKNGTCKYQEITKPNS